jgi:regulator of sigma E protease
MNLLPIPGLDGGYVVFTLIEMITGRKVNEKVMEVATTIGLILLLGLMLYANGMDIFRIFKK